jgi:hypothetical protein
MSRNRTITGKNSRLTGSLCKRTGAFLRAGAVAAKIPMTDIVGHREFLAPTPNDVSDPSLGTLTLGGDGLALIPRARP